MNGAKGRVAGAFAAGLVFAIGLVLSGMTDTTKILGFLDFTGHWQPNLALVMVGAIGVHVLVRWLFRGAKKPLFAVSFPATDFGDIDRRLVVGAAIFGVGWGLGGYCPGPAIVSVGDGIGSAILFVATMALGMGLVDLGSRRASAAAAAE